MSELILLDVFSYSCMNCLRSLEFIKRIDDAYKKFGLRTIIVHSPEWSFEKNSDNIVDAMKKYRINLQMIIDKDKKILKKLKINFWPMQILIRNGKILYKHIGEGNYKKLEDKIVKLLNIHTKRIFNREPTYSKYPTVYCGGRKKGEILNLANKLKFGIIYKNGKWTQKDEYLQSNEKQCSLTILTKGMVINFIAESLDKKPVKVTIKLNNELIKKLMVNKPQLYNIAKLKDTRQKKMTITAPKNVAIYSFSFQ